MSMLSEQHTNIPRRWGGDVSLCQTGSIEVMPPMPTPATTRPTASCAVENVETCSAAPTMRGITEVNKTARRDQRSPKTETRRAPAKHPSS
jgi:hypothetical protein